MRGKRVLLLQQGSNAVEAYRVSPGDAIVDFLDAMRRRGIVPPPDLITDGRIHRCAVEGARRGKRDGAYILHISTSPLRAALEIGRMARLADLATARTARPHWPPAERAAFDAKVAARKKADEEKRQRLAETARQRGDRAMATPAQPIPDIPISSRSRSSRTGFAKRERTAWCRCTTWPPARSSTCSESCRTAISAISPAAGLTARGTSSASPEARSS